VTPARRTLSFAVGAMKGTWLTAPAPDLTFAGAAADSRRAQAGELFFALPGARVDGFDYAAGAVAAGAVAVVVPASRGIPPNLIDRARAGGVAIIGVADVVTALGDLARAVRSQFRGHVVGVTGSNGKTTTKELCAAALSVAGPVHRTAGSYNTEIGLPLTILAASGQESFWVLEMAMRGRGQIALLADIARPQVGVITNVAGAHLELLGSIEEVARAKGELFAGLGPEGIAVLPGGDPLIEPQAAHLPERRKLRFDGGGPGPKDVVIIEALPAGVAGLVVRYAVHRQPVVARLALSGLHNARNGAAALAVAAALRVPIPAAAQALAKTELPPHRSHALDVAGRIVLDDCYNANVASMRAGLETVTSSAAGGAGRAFAILGDMLEIGGDPAAQHRAVGREVGGKLAGLVTVGNLAAEIALGAREGGLDAGRIAALSDPAEAAAKLAPWTRPGDWILVKASRGMKLERAIDALVENFATGRR